MSLVVAAGAFERGKSSIGFALQFSLVTVFEFVCVHRSNYIKSMTPKDTSTVRRNRCLKIGEGLDAIETIVCCTSRRPSAEAKQLPNLPLSYRFGERFRGPPSGLGATPLPPDFE